MVCLTDIHCSYQYSSLITHVIARKDVDLVLIAGDIECEHPLDEILGVGVKVYAVTGNMDDTYIYRVLREKGVGIDGSIVEYKGYYVAGIGGIGFRTNYERVLNEIKCIDRDRLVVLSHYPAYGFNDKTYSGVHAGLKELRDLIMECQPLLFIHGHIHEARGIARCGNTVIVNPGPLMHGYYSVIDISDTINVVLERL